LGNKLRGSSTDTVIVQIWIDRDLHAEAKELARNDINLRTLQMFCLEAIKEKVFSSSKNHDRLLEDEKSN
jgi:hypothetical protein